MTEFREFTLTEITEGCRNLMRDPQNLESASNEIFDDLVEEVIMGLIFEVHHGLKTGITALEEGTPEDEEAFLIVDRPDVDIFGQSIAKKPQECICPKCDRTVAASRFAPHLERCMGMGRNSSRIASRRIANNSREGPSYVGTGLSDDDDDVDWTGEKKRKKIPVRNSGGKKVSRANNGTSSRPTTRQSVGEGLVFFGPLGEYGLPMETEEALEWMTIEEKRNLYNQICGVISEHTRKLCTRSVRCPQHSPEQRKAIRWAILELPEDQQNAGSSEGTNDRSITEESVDRLSSSPSETGSTSSNNNKKKEKPVRGRPPKARKSSPSRQLE